MRIESISATLEGNSPEKSIATIHIFIVYPPKTVRLLYEIILIVIVIGFVK